MRILRCLEVTNQLISAYTDKQKRQAEHIEESEKERGHSEEEAERIAWSTVNKQDGGGKKKKTSH